MRLWVGIALVAMASSARADTDDEIARAHFQTGLSYYDSDRFGPAIKEFLEAHRLSPRPKLLYNIARAYERLGDAGRASTFYRRYLGEAPSPPERDEVQATLIRLAPQIGRITVRTQLAGSEVILDGESAGPSSLTPLEVTQGKHHLEVRHTGYLPAQLDVEVRGGQSAEVRADPTAAVDRSGPADPSTQGRVDLTARRRPRWLWPVVGVAAAVVVAVVAVVLAVTLSGTNYGDVARSSCTAPGCVVWPP